MPERTPAPAFADPDDYARFRDLLENAPFKGNAIVERLGTDDLSRVRTAMRPLFLARTSACTPLDVLIRLFLLRVPVDVPTLAGAIRPMSVERWMAAGLIVPYENDRAAVVAAVEFVPFRGRVMLSDRPVGESVRPPEDFVMGIGLTSRILLGSTVRSRVKSALDIGCGAGIQSFVAGEHAERVVGVDRNARAIAFARFNARINGAENVEFVQGNFFEPVAGMEFDLIVSNPPFVIAPASGMMFRDAGMPGDAVTATVVRSAAERLAEGGFAHVLCNWAHVQGTDGKERVKKWTMGLGCDVLVLSQVTKTGAEYAAQWIDETERGSLQERWDTFTKWIELYKSLGINGVESGLITLRKRSGPPYWFATETVPTEPVGEAGGQLARIFANLDLIQSAANGGPSLLDTRLKPSESARVNRRSRADGAGWVAESTMLTQTEGFAFSCTVDSEVSAMLAACDGRKTLRELAKNFAPGGEVSERTLETAEEVAIRLLGQGFLTVAHGEERAMVSGQ